MHGHEGWALSLGIIGAFFSLFDSLLAGYWRTGFADSRLTLRFLSCFSPSLTRRWKSTSSMLLATPSLLETRCRIYHSCIPYQGWGLLGDSLGLLGLDLVCPISLQSHLLCSNIGFQCHYTPQGCTYSNSLTSHTFSPLSYGQYDCIQWPCICLLASMIMGFFMPLTLGDYHSWQQVFVLCYCCLILPS